MSKEHPILDIRMGIGYDVHKLTEGRALILGGVTIPFDRGLLGHSDADVLAHAIGDAMLGAAAMGDIGHHFPDTDDRYRNVSSLWLLEQITQRVMETGYVLSNIDSTVVAQRPKLAPYISEMRKTLSAALNLSTDRMSVKATTSERLGFMGREEGIAAYATALIKTCP